MKQLRNSFQTKETQNWLYTVKNWNGFNRQNGKHILVYTLDNGSMLDIPRQRGYVVQKRHIKGGERSKFHLHLDKALEDYYSNTF